MLISPDYVEQNQLLHNRSVDYGANSWRHADKIKALMQEYECFDLLDYGCGKGSLLEKIPGSRGYDPALTEFSVRPFPADLVSCTDVMEHIEPECLDDVLEDIRGLTKKLCAFIVACRPAQKTLPDGRNAHLIVESEEWWINKLSEYFHPAGWKVLKGEIVFLGSPRTKRYSSKKAGVKAFSEYGTPAFAKKQTLFIPTTIGAAQIKSSCALGLEDTVIGDSIEQTMSLCAYGPSLANYLDDLRKATNVVTTSGAHDFLIKNGIIPHSHMEADAHKHKARFMSLAQEGIHYYLASRCHEDCFTTVMDKTKDVKIWHIHHSVEENLEVKNVYPEALFIGGSSSIASRAFCLGIVLGYRNFDIYAMDCSFPWDESLPFEEQKQHADFHPNPQDVFKTDPIDGKVFYTTLQLLNTADEFLLVLRRAVICNVTIRGKGLLATKAKLLNMSRIKTPDL